MTETPHAAAAQFQAKIQSLTQAGKPDPQAIAQAVQEMVTSFMATASASRAQKAERASKRRRHS